MALFQKSVLNTFSQDESKVALRWAEYQKFLAKVDAIKGFKEEEYQDGFFKDVFENCLGYTLKTTNPSNFNLEREKKNETDSKKADGVIYVDGEVIGVVELKDQKTKQLDAIETQAFNYHNSHSNSKYVIISNFDELRFYIDKKTAYEKFNLFNLSYDEFKKLHLLLSFESIKENIPQKLKDKSSTFEQSISKELYKDFTLFRTHLFENIIANNPAIDKALLLRLTQKLCDRVIFILFAEDRGLLRHNTIKEIREEFANQRFTDYKLYDIYKFYFEGINTGNAKLNIPKYNGGLFATDELLDSLKIDDVCLNENAQNLSNYDFVSDISVNILGHIFEQSLSDLEELNASLNDLAFDKKNSKRKKDGVFYTPEYITRYIVENTLGKLCTEKKEALHVSLVEAPKNSKKPTKEEAQTKENLEHYKEWLLHVKILDPACGSGAFLNQALEYLIKEHKELQEKLAIMGDITAYYEIEVSILENNLYGVDINEDAVEIARLSLWLRTAQQGRALANLSDKIKCANSLLDMPFAENSFDVVIGNPPYVRQEAIKELKPLLEHHYDVYSGTADLYVYFYELAYKMLKPNALTGYICSNKFFRAKYGEKLRALILEKMTIQKIADFNGVKIFEDATVDSAITIFKKEIVPEMHMFEIVDEQLENHTLMKQVDLSVSSFSFSNPAELIIKQKIENVGTPLKDWNIKINYGIKTGFNEAFIIDSAKKDELIAKDKKSAEIIKPMLRGRDIKRYSYIWAELWLLYIPWNFQTNKYPIISEHLETFKSKLSERPEVKQGRYPWYALSRYASDYVEEFEKEKIVYPEFSSSSLFAYDENKSYLLDTTWFIDCGDKYLLACLNSKLIWHYLEYISSSLGSASLRMKKIFVEQIPIPQISEVEQKPFITYVDEILESKQKLKDYKILLDEALHVNNFDREIKLKKEIETFEKRIVECEYEIDKMVYKLYGLSEDEIKIVEGK